MNRLATVCGSPQAETDAIPANGRERLAWLDLYRGAAVLVMIETNVVNTFLATGIRESEWFSLLNYVNGLVAPSFLYIAGFLPGLERRRSRAKPVNFSRRASRLLGIAALGYLLHFPGPELAQHRWADALRVGTQFDILQCLATSLGLLLCLTWLAEKIGGRRGATAWWCGAAGLAAAAVVGASIGQAWVGGSVPLRALINQTTGSLFPLLPWAGFVFLGALTGAWPQRPIHERAAGILGLACLAWVCRGPTFSAVSPAFFLERAAWVLILAALVEWSARRPMPEWLVFAGRRSLTLYVAHLVILSTLVAAGMPPSALALPWALALIAATVVASLAMAHFTIRVPSLLPALLLPKETPRSSEVRS